MSAAARPLGAAPAVASATADAVACDAAPRRRMSAADLMCGAGGTSLAIRNALDELGHDVDLAVVNHWETAIATHSIHFPQARHYCQDIATLRPEEAVPGGHLDLLCASPVCTHHSRARGGKPTSDQQRADPWHVITWLTRLEVDRLFIENVPEFRDWGPVDPATGKPIKARKGEYFKQWIATIRGLGFDVDWRVVNAADHGDATTRERFYLQGRRDGAPITWPAPAYAKSPRAGLTRWRPARECIDWSLRGTSIFARPRPLSPNTIARIAAGIVKFHWPEPFLIVLRQHMAARGLDLPLPTITTSGRHIGLVEPVILKQHFRRDAQGIEEPLPTATSVPRIGLIEPFIATVAHGAQERETDPHTRRARSIEDPLQTIHAGGGKFALVEPFVLSQGGGGAPRASDDPLPTIPGGGAHALIAPYYGSGSGKSCSSAEDPLPSVTTRDRFGLVVPITHTRPGQFDGRSRSIDEPLATVTGANRGELAFIVPAFGERAGQAPRSHSIDDPLPTICAEGRTPLVEGAEISVRDGGGNVLDGVNVYDILYRMLQPHELAAAMSLMDGGRPMRFQGTKTAINKQIGNAVPERTARAIIKELMSR